MSGIEYSTLDWLVTLFVVHVLMLVGVILMFRGAPCWMQKMSLFALGLAAIVFCGAYLAAIFGVSGWPVITAPAFVLEHLAVLLYIFRILWQGATAHGNADRPTAQVR